MKAIQLIIVVFTLAISTHAAPHSTEWVRLETGPGMPMTASTTGFNFRLGSSVRVARKTPLYLGLDTGFDVLSVQSKTYTMMPILVTSTYRWEKRKQDLTPYLGVALGPYVGVGGGAGVEFAFFLKPGVDIKFNRTLGLSFETKLGARDGNFYLSPQASLLISL